jgi:hypothetical protein
MIPRIGLGMLAGALLWPSVAAAEGALALGMPADVAKDGFAYGYKVRAASRQEARAEALNQCRTTEVAGQYAKSLCKIVSTFRNDCVAIAMDPAPGTPGAGWGVGPNREAAERRAMNMCLETAGASRRQFCKVDNSNCDTTASAPAKK